MNKETYHIEISVLDKNGNSIKDESGIKRLSLKSELSFDKNSNYTNGIKGALKSQMIQMGKTVKAWMPDAMITVEASVHNSISGTYMNMHSYYVGEDRYVNH